MQILSQRHTDQVLVFGKTKHGCNRLAEQLEEAGLPSVAIHGNKSQAARQKALKDFKSGKARCWSPPTSPRAASTSPTCRW
jgi:ATP-dependent RNA helicase RhlE